MSEELVTAKLLPLVIWTAKDHAYGREARGAYRIATKDVGATIGVGVYEFYADCSGELIHSFYAHTSHASYAEDIARELILEAVKFIQHASGAGYVIPRFPEVFPQIVRDADHRDLPAEWLTEGRPEYHGMFEED
jgi:hypothetical protein